MCGIAGYLNLSSAEDGAALLARMNVAIAHRGPDAGTTWQGDGVGLAHRRLSIIDVVGSNQPMFNEDGEVVVVYNGEIYNFAEVRADLVAAGHVFRTNGDTETIVHGWEEWGEDCVDRFRGMFAFAVWDNRRKCLFLARDRLGIKPLYIGELPGGGVVFGSELKALLQAPDLSRELDTRAVEDYFAFGYIPDPRTALRAVRQLSPGHTLLLQRGGPMAESRQYWDIPVGEPFEDDACEWTEELVTRLEEAVRVRLVSEVPLGAFLSGGVDSSAVVAMMARVAGPDQLNTCSISFDDPRYDEAEYAREVAARHGTNHREQQVVSDDFGLIDTLAHAYDEPFADSSAIPTYRLCELARKHVTVALSGDGGDEMLAGYTRYRFHMAEEKLRGRIPLGMRRLVFGPLGQLYPKLDWAPRWLRARSTFQSLAMSSKEAYFNTVSLMNDEVRGRLLSADLRNDLGGYRASMVFDRHLSGHGELDPLTMATYLDSKTYLPGDILTKVDRASMAHSLEVRVPLIDHRLVEWMARVPTSLKLRGSEGKYLLKKAMEPHLPHRVLYRRKQGFSVPLARWLRGPLAERVQEQLTGGWLASCGLFDNGEVQRLVRQHQSGVRDNGEYLWALMMFDASHAAMTA